MTQEVKSAPQEQKVENIGQAVQVLIQAVEIGRQKGIYGWEDAALIGQALTIIQSKPATAANTSDADVAITEDSAE